MTASTAQPFVDQFDGAPFTETSPTTTGIERLACPTQHIGQEPGRLFWPDFQETLVAMR